MYAVVDPTSQSDYHFQSMARLRQFLKQTTGLDTTTMAEFQLLLGITIGFQMIIRFGTERCQRILDVMARSKSKDPKGLWKADLDSIKLDALRDLMFKVDRSLLRFDDVIAYCHSVTVEQFNLRFGDDLNTTVLKEMALTTETGFLDTPAILKTENKEKEELEILIAKRDKEDLEKKREIEEAWETAHNNRLIDFDLVDKKIEAMFGLKMGEFLKEDEEILQNSIGGQSFIRGIRDEPKDDTLFKDIADDLKSRRTGKSGKNQAVDKKSPKIEESKANSKQNQSKNKTVIEESF